MPWTGWARAVFFSTPSTRTPSTPIFARVEACSAGFPRSDISPIIAMEGTLSGRETAPNPMAVGVPRLILSSLSRSTLINTFL